MRYFSVDQMNAFVSDSFLKLNLQHGYRYLSETGSFHGLSAYFSTLEPAFSSHLGRLQRMLSCWLTAPGKLFMPIRRTTHCMVSRKKNRKIAILIPYFRRKANLLSLRKYQGLFQLEEENHLLESRHPMGRRLRTTHRNVPAFLYRHGERLPS